MRPTILGEAFGYLGPALGVLTATVLWRRLGFLFRRAFATGLVLTAALWLSVLAAKLVTHRAPSITTLTMNLIADGCALSAGLAFAARHDALCRARKALVWLSSGQILAYTTMLVLRWIAPVLVSSPVFTFSLSDFGGRPATYQIYFPGAITVGSGGFAAELGPRLTGFAGEPGVFAALLAVLMVFPREASLWRSLRAYAWFLLGIIYTQSTGGIAAAIAGLACVVVLRLPRIWAPFFVVLVAASTRTTWALYQRSPLGLASKESSNKISVVDRLGSEFSLAEVIRHWVQFPFGEQFTSNNNGSINLVMASMTLGPVVLILTLAALTLPVFMTPEISRSAPACAALVLTLLVSQPGLQNPLWLYLLGLAIASTTQFSTQTITSNVATSQSPLTISMKRSQQGSPSVSGDIGRLSNRGAFFEGGKARAR